MIGFLFQSSVTRYHSVSPWCSFTEVGEEGVLGYRAVLVARMKDTLM